MSSIRRASLLGTWGLLWSAGLACGRRTSPEVSELEMFPGIDSTTALAHDTAVRSVAVSRDTLWQDFDRPYKAHIASNYRVMLWLCSRDAVRLVFYSIIRPDWPPPGRQFNLVSYQLVPQPARTDTFRLQGGNWMERDLGHTDLSQLGRATALRVRYEARGGWPSAGEWRMVLSESARAGLREWADSCAHGRW
jgi:hypothetical protein